VSWPPQTSIVALASRTVLISPMLTIAMTPPARRPSDLLLTPLSSRHGRRALGMCRNDVRLAPASQHSAERFAGSVAPEALGCNPGPPTGGFEALGPVCKARVRFAAADHKRPCVQRPSCTFALASNSACEDLRPFIFHWPAIRCRRRRGHVDFHLEVGVLFSSRAAQRIPDTVQVISESGLNRSFALHR